jgi:5-methylcytosine-specific restriction endonuclease McrA
MPVRKMARPLHPGARVSGWISSKSQRRIMERDAFRCVYCGVPQDHMTLSLDHLMPRSRGGGNSDANLVTACFPCNVEKGDRTIAEWLAHRSFRTSWMLSEGHSYTRDFSRFTPEQMAPSHESEGLA